MQPVVSYFALGGPAAVLFSSAENDSLENNSCNRTPLTAAIVLRPGHALTLAGANVLKRLLPAFSINLVVFT